VSRHSQPQELPPSSGGAPKALLAASCCGGSLLLQGDMLTWPARGGGKQRATEEGSCSGCAPAVAVQAGGGAHLLLARPTAHCPSTQASQPASQPACMLACRHAGMQACRALHAFMPACQPAEPEVAASSSQPPPPLTQEGFACACKIAALSRLFHWRLLLGCRLLAWLGASCPRPRQVQVAKKSGLAEHQPCCWLPHLPLAARHC